ncbi:undecaprenyl-diphosphate phosphatase [Petrotoga sp. 9PWA.NaAc.5.4]|uniref:undecaprenyl-diphosphate phosphatase n=1 Tax=Petrotoga sp. 9PWA.NaAc.5.4 TaxID=1434328 RepID=UPI000CC3A346|nr:undecaprenyl-diphosphate phosphatase [Petrotoga sp. 9PWA.NaAc.5.4]PNR93640.1 UDP-diphosphatase [Petrotoga sp. 9PWA.NaAc.5.4]
MKNIILGIVQGLTEFLPVSSSGHLVIFSNFMEIETNVPYFALLHLATFFAVLIFVWKEVIGLIVGLFKWEKSSLSLIMKLIVSSIPAVLVGFTVESKIESAFSSTTLVGIFLLITGILLFISDSLKGKKTLREISYIDALIIGIMQAIAIFPGISRSGATLFGALLMKTKREDAVKYSFLMSLPVTFGAGILEINQVYFDFSIIIGTLSAFIAGLFGLFLLQKTVIAGKLKYFSYYCFIVGILTIVVI